MSEEFTKFWNYKKVHDDAPYETKEQYNKRAAFERAICYFLEECFDF